MVISKCTANLKGVNRIQRVNIYRYGVNSCKDVFPTFIYPSLHLFTPFYRFLCFTYYKVISLNHLLNPVSVIAALIPMRMLKCYLFCLIKRDLAHTNGFASVL